MFQFRSETDIKYKDKGKIEVNLPNYLRSHSIWKEIEEYWFNYHSDLIESQGNLKNLKKIFTNEKDVLNPLEWLNGYLEFLKKNSTIVSKKKIFPNQNEELVYLENIQYDDSIPELLKDILNSLKRIEDKNYDIRDLLLSKEIICYKGHNKFAQKEIISQIENLFTRKEVTSKNQNDQVKNHLITSYF